VAFEAARRRRSPVPSEAASAGPAFRDSCDLPPPTRRWGFVVPTALLVVLFAARGVAYLPKPSPVDELLGRASTAYAAERFEAAAEYARHAIDLGPGAEQKGELLSVRGESLLRLEQTQRAREVFETLVADLPASPYRAQALSGAMRAARAAGDQQGAAALRDQLLREFPDTPWAESARP
jgi:tetratricopeptide (TPR) repeat protein